MWTVDLIESERGWGQRLDETLEFDDYDKACEYVRDFNAQNDLPHVPDWYMYATPPKKVRETKRMY